MNVIGSFAKKTWESFMALHFPQNSMFHFTLYFTQSVLHFVFVIWVCTRDSTFLHSTFNFDLCNIQVFAFDIQLFISNSQVFEFDLQVSICPLVFASDIRLWALYLQVSAFDIQLFELNFYPLVSDRWRSLAQLTWLTPAQMVVESRSRDFPVEWTRESFSPPDKPDVDNR